MCPYPYVLIYAHGFVVWFCNVHSIHYNILRNIRSVYFVPRVSTSSQQLWQEIVKKPSHDELHSKLAELKKSSKLAELKKIEDQQHEQKKEKRKKARCLSLVLYVLYGAVFLCVCLFDSQEDSAVRKTEVLSMLTNLKDRKGAPSSCDPYRKENASNAKQHSVSLLQKPKAFDQLHCESMFFVYLFAMGQRSFTMFDYRRLSRILDGVSLL